MPFDIGLNFRATAGLVTDGPNETYVLGTDTYPTTRGGATFGYVGGKNAPSDTRDRTTSVDRRLCGLHFGRQVADDDFQIDLPASGDYDIHIGLGDIVSGTTIDAVLKDGTTTVTSWLSAGLGAGNFYDANGNVYSSSNWPSSETALPYTFASTEVHLINKATSNLSVVNHIRVLQTGFSFLPMWARQTNTLTGAGF